MPGALELVVLILASYRVWRLLALDEILDAIRDPLLGFTADADFARPALARFIGCAFCFGFWISLAIYGAWLSAPRPTLYAMTPFAISGAAGLIAKNLDT